MIRYPVPSEYAKMTWYDETSGTWKDLTTTDHVTRAVRVEVPDSVKRSKPADLFASATGRVVTEYRHDNPVRTFGHRSWVYSGPISAITGIGDSGVDAIDASFSSGDGRLRAKIKSENLNLAQSVAEYRQTAGMFVGAARDIVSAFHSLRSGRALADFVRILQKPRNAKEKALANRWLEYQYGLKPLMGDIYGATDLLAGGIRTGMPIYASTSFSDQQVTTQSKSWTFDGGVVNGSLITTESFIGKARSRYIVSDSSMKSLAQMGITNPAALAWELVPYSFVIDWMVPVGDYLSSLDALNGVSGLVVNRSGLYTKRCDYITPYGSCSYSISRKTRQQTSSSLAMPSLGYKPSKSLTAVANGLALLRQLRP